MTTSGRVVKLLKNAKLSPESSPCPGVAIQTPRATTPSQITGVNSDYGLRTLIFATLFFRRKNVFKVGPRRPDQACRPLDAKTATMPFHSQFAGQIGPWAKNPSVVKHSGGLPGHTADRPGATSASTWHAAASTRGSVGLAAAQTSTWISTATDEPSID